MLDQQPHPRREGQHGLILLPHTLQNKHLHFFALTAHFFSASNTVFWPLWLHKTFFSSRNFPKLAQSFFSPLTAELGTLHLFFLARRLSLCRSRRIRHIPCSFTLVNGTHLLWPVLDIVFVLLFSDWHETSRKTYVRRYACSKQIFSCRKNF